jgi:hypothetical protein
VPASGNYTTIPESGIGRAIVYSLEADHLDRGEHYRHERLLKMTQPTRDIPNQRAEDTMSKLVGALLVELAYDVPDKPGFESVKADLLAASTVYESGEKKDLALRFYLAIRSLFHELKRLERT